MDVPPRLEVPPLVVRCPRCGSPATKRFCSQCGASLDPADGSLGGEIKSRFLDPVIGLLAFVKIAWLLIVKPTDFCRAWLLGPQGMAQLGFPLSAAWRRLSGEAQHILSPFRAFAVGLGLITAAAIVDATAWRLAGLEELREQAGRRQAAAIQQASRIYFGHGVKIVKLSELTGLTPLDTALEETWNLFDYLAFAAFIALFMPRLPLAHPRAVFQYFAFAVAVGLAIRTAAVAAGAVMFVPLAGLSLEAALALENVIVFFFGYLPMIWFGALLPIVVFPRVIRISHLRIIAAVVGGLATMGMINVIRTPVMLVLGLVIQ